MAATGVPVKVTAEGAVVPMAPPDFAVKVPVGGAPLTTDRKPAIVGGFGGPGGGGPGGPGGGGAPGGPGGGRPDGAPQDAALPAGGRAKVIAGLQFSMMTGEQLARHASLAIVSREL
jgi:hypothetical protein